MGQMRITRGLSIIRVGLERLRRYFWRSKGDIKRVDSWSWQDGDVVGEA